MPLILPLIALPAIGPLLGWKRGDLPGRWAGSNSPSPIAATRLSSRWWIHGGPALALLGMALAAWLLRRRR